MVGKHARKSKYRGLMWGISAGLFLIIVAFVAVAETTGPGATSAHHHSTAVASASLGDHHSPAALDQRTLSATTTSTTLPALRTPTAADPLRILVVGDSLSIYLTSILQQHLAGMPVVVTGDSHSSTGLARPDALDWPKELLEDVGRVKPDAIFMLIGGNDAQSLNSPTGWTQITDFDVWKAEYRKRVDNALSIMTSQGATVWWIGLPVMRPEKLDTVGPVIDSIVKDAVDAHGHGAHFIDSNPILAAPNGTFRDYETAPDGTNVKLREADGVHITRVGEEQLVLSFLPAFLAEHHLSVPPTAPAK